MFFELDTPRLQVLMRPSRVGNNLCSASIIPASTNAFCMFAFVIVLSIISGKHRRKSINAFFFLRLRSRSNPFAQRKYIIDNSTQANRDNIFCSGSFLHEFKKTEDRQQVTWLVGARRCCSVLISDDVVAYINCLAGLIQHTLQLRNVAIRQRESSHPLRHLLSRLPRNCFTNWFDKVKKNIFIIMNDLFDWNAEIFLWCFFACCWFLLVGLKEDKSSKANSM